jgi:hypothetical protein
VHVSHAAPGIHHDGSAQLQRILFGHSLPSAGQNASRTSRPNLRACDVDQVSASDTERPVGLPLVVDEEREGDSLGVAEVRGHLWNAHADRQQIGSRPFEFLVVVPQLRDVVTTEGSAVVTKPHDDRRPVRPELAQPSLLPVGVGEPDVFYCRQIRHATDSRRPRWHNGHSNEGPSS